MIVPDGGTPIRLTIPPSTGEIPSPTSTGSLSPDEIDWKIQHPPFSLGYRPKTDKISFSTGTIANQTGITPQTGILSVTFQNYHADSYYLSFGTEKIDVNQPFPNPDPNPHFTGPLTTTGTVTITGSFAASKDPHITRTYALRVCYRGYCSAPDIKYLG